MLTWVNERPKVRLTLAMIGARLEVGGGYAPGFEHWKDSSFALIHNAAIESCVSRLYESHKGEPLRVNHPATMIRLAAELQKLVEGCGLDLSVEVVPLVEELTTTTATIDARRAAGQRA